MPLTWMSRVINGRHFRIRWVEDYGNRCSDGNSFVGIANCTLGFVRFAIDDKSVIDMIVVSGTQFVGD